MSSHASLLIATLLGARTGPRVPRPSRRGVPRDRPLRDRRDAVAASYARRASRRAGDVRGPRRRSVRHVEGPSREGLVVGERPPRGRCSVASSRDRGQHGEGCAGRGRAGRRAAGSQPARHPVQDAGDRRRPDAVPRLLAIGAFCIGTDQIDLAAAVRAGVAVFNAPFSNTRSVVELAIAEMIALTRRLTEKNAGMHAGIWDKSADGSHEIRGRRLGIVGYGNIGTQLSVLAENLGMSVYFYDTADKLALGNARRCAVPRRAPRDRRRRDAARRRPRRQRGDSSGRASSRGCARAPSSST